MTANSTTPTFTLIWSPFRFPMRREIITSIRGNNRKKFGTFVTESSGRFSTVGQGSFDGVLLLASFLWTIDFLSNGGFSRAFALAPVNIRPILFFAFLYLTLNRTFKTVEVWARPSAYGWKSHIASWPTIATKGKDARLKALRTVCALKSSVISPFASKQTSRDQSASAVPRNHEPSLHRWPAWRLITSLPVYEDRRLVVRNTDTSSVIWSLTGARFEWWVSGRRWHSLQIFIQNNSPRRGFCFQLTTGDKAIPRQEAWFFSVRNSIGDVDR